MSEGVPHIRFADSTDLPAAISAPNMAQPKGAVPSTKGNAHIGASKEMQTNHSSNTRTAFENILVSAKILQADGALKTILDNIDKVPLLESQIQSNIERDRLHEEARLQALADYNHDRDKWISEKQTLETSLRSLQQEVEGYQRKCNALQSAEKRQADQVRALEDLTNRQREDMGNQQKSNQGLINAIRSEREKSDSLQDALDQAKIEIAQINDAKTQLQKAFATVETRADCYAKELQAAADITVPLKDDPQVLEKLDPVWGKAASLICSTFLCNADLANPKTANFWIQLAQTTSAWNNSLPVPKSNTPAAKQMRCVMILARLSRAFADHLLQPTYLLPEESGIRDLLVRQAQDHLTKESTMRALFQAMLQGEQEVASSTRIAKVCGIVMDLVDGLLPKDKEAQFREQLQDLAEEAREIWQEVCRFTEAIEPRFDLQDCTDWSWNQLLFEADRPIIVDQGQQSRSGPDQALFAVFPRLYTIAENIRNPAENIRTPETHGVLFMWSQAQAAREEVGKLHAGPRAGRSNSARIRSKFQRTSNETTTSQTRPEDQHRFLGAGEG